MQDKLASKQDLKDLKLSTGQDFKELKLSTSQDTQDLKLSSIQGFKDVQQSMLLLESRVTVRMGAMMAAFIAILTAIQKLL